MLNIGWNSEARVYIQVLDVINEGKTFELRYYGTMNSTNLATNIGYHDYEFEIYIVPICHTNEIYPEPLLDMVGHLTVTSW